MKAREVQYEIEQKNHLSKIETLEGLKKGMNK